VDVTIKWEKASDEIAIPRVNENVVRQYAAMARDLKENYGLTGDLTIESVFTLKDVFAYEENNSLPEDVLTAACSDLIAALNEERAREGGHIMNDLLGRLDAITASLAEIQTGWRRSSRPTRRGSGAR
jgi:uncharacterized protein YicC (UPF0701 family)